MRTVKRPTNLLECCVLVRLLRKSYIPPSPRHITCLTELGTQVLRSLPKVTKWASGSEALWHLLGRPLGLTSPYSEHSFTPHLGAPRPKAPILSTDCYPNPIVCLGHPHPHTLPLARGKLTQQ